MQSLGSVLASGAVITFEVSLGAWLVSISTGMVLGSFRSSRMLVWRGPAAAVITLIRSLPWLIVLYIFYFGLGGVGINLTAKIAAIVGLGIADGVYTAEYFRSALLTVPDSQREAAASVGLSRVQIARKIVLPEALPFFMIPVFNSFLGLTKAATYASAIGVPEVLFKGENYMAITGRVGWTAGVILAAYIVVTVPLTILVRRIETRVRGRR